MFLLGVPYFHDLNEVVANAERICKASHSEPLCVSAAVTLTVMVSLLLQVGTTEIYKRVEDRFQSLFLALLLLNY